MTPGNMFLICFAILDFFVILIVVPQIPFIYRFTTQVNNEEPIPPMWFVGASFIIVISYLGIMFNTMIDRLWAVFSPFTYTLNWKRPFIASALCLFCGILLFMCATICELIFRSTQIKKRVLVVFVILTYVTIISSYIAILWKLRKQRRVHIINKHNAR